MKIPFYFLKLLADLKQSPLLEKLFALTLSMWLKVLLLLYVLCYFYLIPMAAVSELV